MARVRVLSSDKVMTPEMYTRLSIRLRGITWRHAIGWGRWAIVLIKSGEK